ncbi:MAG: hypothetical protein QOH18_84 [Solirubrobacterales bacterium]|nr:hypothetical protein [Solirubrobacterales bacterium]
MKRAAPAALLLVLAALIAGCGGGGTTTVIEKTVTVEQGGTETGGSEAEVAGGGAGEEEVGGDEGGEEGAGGGGQGGQAEEKIEEPTAVVHLQSFRSPSGNIGCVMFEGGARCDIRKREWSPPSRPASCPEQVDFGQGLSVEHTGEASVVCAGDTALDPSATELAYGEASELGGTQCISRSEGITCANHSGHGFFISTQSYNLF